MILQFRDGLLIVIILHIFVVDIVNCYPNNVDHVPKEGCSTDLQYHDYHYLNLILRSQITITHCGDCRYRPIERVDVLCAPKFAIKIVHSKPAMFTLWSYIGRRIYDKTLN